MEYTKFSRDIEFIGATASKSRVWVNDWFSPFKCQMYSRWFTNDPQYEFTYYVGVHFARCLDTHGEFHAVFFPEYPDNRISAPKTSDLDHAYMISSTGYTPINVYGFNSTDSPQVFQMKLNQLYSILCKKYCHLDYKPYVTGVIRKGDTYDVCCQPGNADATMKIFIEEFIY